MPESLRYLWDRYIRIRRRKAGGFNGPEPVSHADMRSFALLSGQVFHPWEVELTEKIDDIYLEQSRKKAPPNPSHDKRPAPPAVQKQPLNTVLFDAMFG